MVSVCYEIRRTAYHYNRIALARLLLPIPVPYSKPHESYTGELSFPGEFLHDIPGSLFTELETCRRSNSWLLKGRRARGGHTTASCYDCSYPATL